VRTDLHTDSAVFIGRESISGPQLPGVAWDVEERLSHLGSLNSQLSNSTIQSYGHESQIRLRFLMQERHIVQGQCFIGILLSHPCKGLLPTQFPQTFRTKYFFRNLSRLPRTLNPTLFPYFIWSNYEYLVNHTKLKLVVYIIRLHQPVNDPDVGCSILQNILFHFNPWTKLHIRRLAMYLLLR
jgi:hypothetical protein